MKKPIVHITDHALVRYLERVLEVDVDGLRHRIGREIDARLIEDMPDPCGVTVRGVRYRLQGRSVTTCIPVKQQARKHKRGKR